MSRPVEPPRQASAEGITLTFYWWLHPAPILIAFFVFVFVPTAGLGGDAFAALWGGYKYFDYRMLAIVTLGFSAYLCAFWASTRLGGRGRGGVALTLSPMSVGTVRNWYRIVYLATLLGYIFWVAVAALQGASLAQVQAVLSLEQGAISSLKSVSVPVAGLTTLTQLGPLAAVLWVILRRLGESGRASIGFLVGIAALRSFLYGERLALLEIAVPLLVMMALTARSQSARRWAKRAPALAVPALVAFFSLFEYTRSWQFAKESHGGNFSGYMVDRLLGYYATAANNSGLMYEHVSRVPGVPYFSAPALWDFPLTPVLAGSATVDGVAPGMWWFSQLVGFANPNFTNVGSVLVTAGELGLAGMVVYWTMLGLIAGVIFLRMKSGDLGCLALYATGFVGLLELVRFNYWSLGRFTPCLVACVVLAVQLRGQAGASPHDDEMGDSRPLRGGLSSSRRED